MSKLHLETEYLHDIFNPRIFQSKVNRISKKLLTLKKYGHNFDGIVGTGLSGSLYCSAISYNTKIPFCIVRKEKSHSSLKVEGYVPDQYIIIDDFFVTGKTIANIIKSMKYSKLVGLIFYAYMRGGEQYHPDLSFYDELKINKKLTIIPNDLYIAVR